MLIITRGAGELTLWTAEGLDPAVGFFEEHNLRLAAARFRDRAEVVARGMDGPVTSAGRVSVRPGEVVFFRARARRLGARPGKEDRP